MKLYHFLFLIAFCLALLPGCGNKGDKSAGRSADLLTVKTLGLAYLEEFKLEEAEKEFLKFIELSPKDKFGYANLGLTYLRMGKYNEAEDQLNKAIKRDPKDPDIRLIMATVYKMDNKRDLAINELKKALSSSPGHIKSLYEISEMYSTLSDVESLRQRKNYLTSLIEKAPQNLVPRLTLTDLYINDGEYDKALEQLETVKKQFPEFPKEAIEYYDKTILLLRNKDKQNAIIQFTIFHNYLKVTSPYQAGIMDLKGPGGSLIGFPLITFSKQPSTSQKTADISLLNVIKFTDVTSLIGPGVISKSSADPVSDYPAHIEACDYDSDGDIDLYAGSWDPSSASYRHYLFKNDAGKFSDVSKEAGLTHSGIESSAVFADYDNDGYPDLFIMKEGGDILYRNTGKGTFEDVTALSKAGSKNGGRKAMFFDMDHDGDLDLFEILDGSNLFLRNNSDGTFENVSSKLGPENGNIFSTGAVFSDFDEDEDMDFVVVNKNSGTILYSNQRQGVFKNIASDCGLSGYEGAGAVAAGDYNNDGYPDLFIGSMNGVKNTLLNNKTNGKFEEAPNQIVLPGSISGISIRDARFIDFNNDGFLDLIIAGEPGNKQEKGVLLFYNDGAGNFTDVSRLIPSEVRSGSEIDVSDFDNDGDPDLLIAGLNNRVYILRNDGGNNNNFISLKLVGLRAGSAKNNHFGIGAKIEIRAGDLYETKVVTDPEVLFGLGSHSRADIVRIRWTNGVPQNIFLPGSNQALTEQQTLKGSCPFLYTWDGEKFTFVKDILWRSALGMPTGIMGGNTSYAFADPSDDYLKIPGELLKPSDGSYSIQVTSELWETIYLDKLELVAVDHPDSVDIFVPEQFSPPPFPGLKIVRISGKRSPVSAVNGDGTNALPFIKEEDDEYLSGFKPGKYQGITEMRELVIDPGPFDADSRLYMFLNGWIFPTDASINVAISQSGELKVVPPLIQVINSKGEWETVMNNLGFPMGKDKTVVADLTGKYLSNDHRIKIITNMEIYWDQIFFSSEIPGSPSVLTTLSPAEADIHYRGFSGSFRKGGRFGPHWFDYSVVETEPKWRDLTGNYTRYGDVRPLLLDSDNKYIISNAGDETTVRFSESELPALPEGWKRDFLIRSVGWVKDGDLNTAFGNSVLPLPFFGMKSYPPSAADSYPEDPELLKYNREYNTRIVTDDRFINALK